MNPMRFNVSCPDCGFVETEHEAKLRYVATKGNGSWDCPRCKCHYSGEDFDEHMNEKHMAQHHNHAKADLTNEES